MKSLDTLTTPRTVAQITDSIYTALSIQGVNTTLWKAGSPLRTLIAGLAIILASFSQLQAALARMSFLALATGSWLSLVAFYVFGVTRDPGSFATGSLVLTNGAGGVFTYDPFTVTFSNGSHTYKNVTAISLASGPSTQTITIQATELGSGSSAGATTITTLVTPLPGVTCSNPTALVGNDEEDDATLRLRCAEKLGTLSPNGPRDAYAFVARTSVRADGSSIGVTRIRTIADGYGGIDAYFATGSGGIPGTVGDLSTDLGIVDENLQTQVVPLAITLRSHTATGQTISVTYEVWISSTDTRTDGEIETAIQKALDAFVATRPIGGDQITPPNGVVTKSALEDVVGAAVNALKRIVTIPSADVAITTSHHVPVAGTHTPTAIHRVTGDII